MGQLFKKAAVFTDIHYGAKNNSQIHNQDCDNFIDWAINLARLENCDTGIFMGDWSHHRSSIALTTLDFSIRGLEKLGSAFQQFFWFPGNHDLYKKNSRDLHSSNFGKYVPGVTVINDITTIDDVTMVPWMVGDEWKTVGKQKGRYLFGHLELPGYYMNSVVAMPDHGEIQDSHFQHQEFVFSGHFHKRQNRNKVWYIGNSFPHNYSDSWDDDRGMMTMEWGGQPKFHTWSGAPKYRTAKLSEFLNDSGMVLGDSLHFRIGVDIDISFEEASVIKDEIMSLPNVREFSLLQGSGLRDMGDNTVSDPQEFANVDQIVISELEKLDVGNFDKIKLMNIYSDLS